MFRFCLGLLVVAACGGGTPQPEGPSRPAVDAGDDAAAPLDDATLAAIADELDGVLVQMATIVTARDGDCPAMASELDSLFDRSSLLFDRARAAGADPANAHRLADQLRRHDAEVAPLVDKISKHLASCAGDAAVIKAMERMPTL